MAKTALRLLLLLLGITLGLCGATVAEAACSDPFGPGLGGTMVGSTCHIPGNVTVSSPVTAEGSFEIGGNFLIESTGRITVPSTAAGNALSLDVISGSFVMQTGAQILGDATATALVPHSIGATIYVSASSDVILEGNGLAGALISVKGEDGVCGGLPCVATARGGNVTLISTGGKLEVHSASVIRSGSTGPSGEIVLATADGTVFLDGTIESASGGGVGSQLNAKGGPIHVASASTLEIGVNATLSSRGLRPGADMVHLESGLDMLIRGVVESLAGVGEDDSTNRCRGVVSGSPRPDKPEHSTACIEIWSGGKVTIDNELPNRGSLRASTGQGVITTVTGLCCGWVDVWATGDIALKGRPNPQPPALIAHPYVIEARQSAFNSHGGLVTVMSLFGKVTTSLRTIIADNPGAANGVGGSVTIEAAGPNTYPPNVPHVADLASNVDLQNGYIIATGDTSVAAVGNTTGTIFIRSWNGQITGGAPPPTPPTNPANGILDANGKGGAVALKVHVCDGDLYNGVVRPPRTPVAPQCGGRPEPPSYVDIPVFLKKVTVVPNSQSFVFDGAQHAATGWKVLDFETQQQIAGNEALTFTYNGSPTPPSAVGNYTVVGTYPGDATHRSGTATGQLSITAAANPKATIIPANQTFTYTGSPQGATQGPSTWRVVDPNGADIPGAVITFTYTVSPTNPSMPPTNASGTPYTVKGNWGGNASFDAADEQTGSITINKASATISVTGYSVMYDGEIHEVQTSSVTGVQGETLSPALTFTYAGPGLDGGFPRGVGTYDVTASFAGNTNYNARTVANAAQIVITKGMAIVRVSGGTFTYDGTPKSATGRVEGVGGANLGPPTFKYYADPAYTVEVPPPSLIGQYWVKGFFAGNDTYLPAEGTTDDQGNTAIIVITPAPIPQPIVHVPDVSFVFDGNPHFATATVTVDGNQIDAEVTFTYTDADGNPVTAPTAIGTYFVTATVAEVPGVYLSAEGSGTLTITDVPPPPAEACFIVDFREITYFRNTRVLTSSDPIINIANGLPPDFDPGLWPYDPAGGGGKTRSRGTLFRIYGFKPEMDGQLIPDADFPGVEYSVSEDPDVPGMYYADLGGMPARVRICPSQLQTNLIGESSSVRSYHIPGTAKLTNEQMNVPGIMLNHNVGHIDVPRRVRDEMAALGMPLQTKDGRPTDEGYVDYIGVQQWGRGSSEFREFVDLELSWVSDSQTDRQAHYTYGFHTVKNVDLDTQVSCNYLDFSPGNDGLRMNDNWSGRNTGDPDWGPPCGTREPSRNQSLREQYAVPFNAVQLLTTVNSADDSTRLFFGTIRGVHPNRPPTIEPVPNKTVVAGSTLSFTLHGEDEDGDTLTYSSSPLPAGATLNSSTGAFSWTPTLAQVGSYTITFTVADPAGATDPTYTASTSMTITVKHPNRAPTLAPVPPKTVVIGNTLSFTLQGEDADGDTLTYSATGLPAGASFNATTRTFSWTPTTAQVGTHTVTFKATDPGGLSDSETITITVRANRAPMLADPPDKTVGKNHTLTFTLNGSDLDGDTLTYSSSALPSGASLNASTGKFTWKPTSSQVGTYTITWTVKDPAGLSASQSSKIYVKHDHHHDDDDDDDD